MKIINKKKLPNEEKQINENKKSVKEKRKVITRFKFRKIILIFGWGLLISSLIFGIFKNFTAVDTHTVHEKEKIVEKVRDVSGIETFVQNFGLTYFTLSTDNDFKNDRIKNLEKYMQKDLATINNDMTKELKTAVTAQQIEIWDIKALDSTSFSVLFTVIQQTKEKQPKTVESAYTVEVYSKNNSFVITKNPTVTSTPKKSNYEKKYLTSSDSIEAKTRTNIETFLNTFFKLYPKATSKELVYYVKDSEVSPLNKEYQFVSMDNLVIKKLDTGYQIACFVTYKDKTTSLLLTSQFLLKLDTQEDGEFIIQEMR